MPEIESELNITIRVENIQFLTGNVAADRIIIEKIILTNEEAATLAYLCNHVKGTKLQLQLKRK